MTTMGSHVRYCLTTLTLALTITAFALHAVPASAQQPAAKPAAPAAPAPGAPAPQAPAAKTPQNAAGVGSAWKADVKETPNQAGVTLEPAQLEAIKKVDVYFNELQTMQGRFTQTTSADKKQTRGKFYVKKPGLFRFAYAPPSKLVILSDGNTLSIEDHDLKQVDKYPIDSTPFRLLLRKDVNIARDARILDLQIADDLVVLSIIDKGGDSSGAIKLFFAQKPAFELKEWVITDAQGVETRIEVAELDKVQPIDNKQFQPVSFGALPSTGTGN
jgi:outer membrane lipoprotein-sorting protein